jgi:chromosome condensin MukBEF MukE localization factor
MTREELKEYCEKKVEICERLATINGKKPSGKIYDGYKLVLELLENEKFMNKPCISSEVCEHDKNKVLDKIRAEIEKLQTYKMFVGEKTVYVERDDVLAVIDKHKGESEGK